MSDADLDFLRELSQRQQEGRAERSRRAGGRHKGRRRKKKKSRRLAPVMAFLFLFVVVGGGGFYGFTELHDYMVPPDYTGDGSGHVIVQIKNGDSVSAMGERLAHAHVVKSARAFVKVAKGDPRSTKIQPGFYRMRTRMSASAAFALLLDPKSRSGTRMTIPEGKRASQVYHALSKKTGIPVKKFKAAADHPKALGLPSYAEGRVEGYLFPATYDLDPDATAAQILTMMIDRFKHEAAKVDLRKQAKRLDMPPGDLVKVASLAQAEAGRPSDLGKIVRVIDNRLDRDPPMNLKLGSTVMYALGKYGIVASSEDIRSPSPYNTYNHPGLPPGAICNPGTKALKAAIDPTPGSWLYFVTTDPKRHITKFTVSGREFKKFRKELLRNLEKEQ